jgi:hypothetical protein
MFLSILFAGGCSDWNAWRGVTVAGSLTCGGAGWQGVHNIRMCASVMSSPVTSSILRAGSSASSNPARSKPRQVPCSNCSHSSGPFSRSAWGSVTSHCSRMESSSSGSTTASGAAGTAPASSSSAAGTASAASSSAAGTAQADPPPFFPASVPLQGCNTRQ